MVWVVSSVIPVLLCFDKSSFLFHFLTESVEIIVRVQGNFSALAIFSFHKSRTTVHLLIGMWSVAHEFSSDHWSRIKWCKKNHFIYFFMFIYVFNLFLVKKLVGKKKNTNRRHLKFMYVQPFLLAMIIVY